MNMNHIEQWTETFGSKITEAPFMHMKLSCPPDYIAQERADYAHMHLGLIVIVSGLDEVPEEVFTAAAQVPGAGMPLIVSMN